jgi:hypothetical protein
VEAPPEWIDDLLAVDADVEDDAPIMLRLTADPKTLGTKLAKVNATRAELDLQLESVIAIERRPPSPHHRDPAFSIATPELSLLVRWCLARNNPWHVAKIVDIQRRTTLMPYATPPVLVALYRPWDEAECDLDGILEEFTARLGELAAERAAASDVLAQVPDTDDGTLALVDETERLFAPLEAVFELRQVHEELSTAARAVGTIVTGPQGTIGHLGGESTDVLNGEHGDPNSGGGDRDGDLDDDLFVVRVGDDASQFVADCPVTVRMAAERPCRARVVAVDDDHIRLVPHDSKGRRLLELGAEVEVERVPTTVERQQREALRRFHSRQVVGDWAALARLLCRPGELSAPSPVEDYGHLPPHRRSKQEQEAAVESAVVAPHALFIQGPPGTGKSTVIEEIIRRLTARGERVLLVAPMNVAVDEVLGRLKGDLDLLPIRVAADPQAIRADVRHFHEESVRAVIAERLRSRRSVRRGEEWARRLAVLAEQDQIAGRLFSAHETVRAAATELDAARGVAHGAEQTRRVQDAAADAAVAGAERAVTARTADVEVARRHLDACAATRAAGDADHEERGSVWARLDQARQTAQAEVDALSETERNLRRSLDALRSTWQTADARANRARTDAARAEATLGDLRRRASGAAMQLDHLRRQAAALAAALDHARHELAQAQARRARLRAHLESWLGVGEIGRLADAVTRAEREFAAADESLRAVAADRDRITAWIRTTENDLGRLTETIRRADADSAASMRQSEPLAGELARAVTAHAGGKLRLADAEAAAASASHALDLASAARDLAAERHHRAQTDLAAAIAERERRRAALEEAQADQVAVQDLGAARVDKARGSQAAAERRHEQATVELTTARRAATAAGVNDPDTGGAGRTREAERLRSYVKLEERWAQLAGFAGSTGEDQPGAAQVSADLVATAVIQAANVVCATVEGIAGRDLSRYADFDTLIVDEASRVTDAAFLVSAVRARRWILVGDERQLPPYVDQDTEHLIHALLALDLRKDAGTPLEDAVKVIGHAWAEENDQRVFRAESVLKLARRMLDDGSWGTRYRPALSKTCDRLAGRLLATGTGSADPPRELLQALSRRMVTSLFDRNVSDPGTARLRRRLTVQRRMIEPIASLVSGPVYEGDYVSPNETELRRAGLVPLVCEAFPTPITFYDTHRHREAVDQHIGNGFRNKWEADFVVKVCELWDRSLSTERGGTSDGRGTDAGRGVGAPVTASILTFYKAQAGLIRNKIETRSFERLHFRVIDSIDRIQGQESDLVVISFVRRRGGRPPSGYGLWLQDLHRLNVAITRARRALVMVGHRPTLRRLTGVPQAEGFYSNLFQSLDDSRRSQDMRLVVDAVL